MGRITEKCSFRARLALIPRVLGAWDPRGHAPVWPRRGPLEVGLELVYNLLTTFAVGMLQRRKPQYWRGFQRGAFR